MGIQNCVADSCCCGNGSNRGEVETKTGGVWREPWGTGLVRGWLRKEKPAKVIERQKPEELLERKM